MKLRQDLYLNGKRYPAGTELEWYKIYPFFLIHMLAFGGTSFYLAYGGSGDGSMFEYAWGGFAILIYLFFYLMLFGLDEVKWMFINGGLGMLGISSQIDWILAKFGKHVSDFGVSTHVIPFVYYILYTFVLHQTVLDFTNAHEDAARKRIVDLIYIGVSVGIYVLLWLI